MQGIECRGHALALLLEDREGHSLGEQPLGRIEQDPMLGELRSAIAVAMLASDALAFLPELLLRRRPLDFRLDARTGRADLTHHGLRVVRQHRNRVRDKPFWVIHVRIAVGAQDCEGAHLRR